MKTVLLALFRVSMLCVVFPVASVADNYDDTHRFVFYAVLEGCYEDGLSTNAIERILVKSAQGSHLHFIYACPLCMPAIHAFEAYRSKPTAFHGDKRGTSTFGAGLKPDLIRKLDSAKVDDRLEVINSLVRAWIERRMSLLRLSEQERATLKMDLEAKRKEGMETLLRFKRNGDIALFAPGFVEKEECAVCNGAVGMDFSPRGN